MTDEPTQQVLGLNEFFAASEARVDRWRTLNRLAKSLAGTRAYPAGAVRQEPKELLAELAPLEELCAYPGPRLMAQVYQRL
jgi:arginine decarboxylase